MSLEGIAQTGVVEATDVIVHCRTCCGTGRTIRQVFIEQVIDTELKRYTGF
ncbi:MULTISPECIES: hypothetical protein [Shewanella]|uniref:hypothetical protein n=1 Tax=Shewanella TaxID=22 RepID=UPI002359CBC4|nr:hypothetical protein [Shewanella algae]MDC8852482.1 hypothetical protein [Shewanella algae]